MRLRNWIAVLVSVLLLACAGVVGILVNRSAVQAVERVHRNDTTALGDNNGTLTAQLQTYSAVELGRIAAQFAGPGAGPARLPDLLSTAARKSSTFTYGLMVADATGARVLASRPSGLPSTGDAGWRRMWAQVRGGGAGFSDIMLVEGGDAADPESYVAAVAVPIPTAAGYLIGLNQVARTSLQGYIGELKSDLHETTIVDATGRIGAASVRSRVGSTISRSVFAPKETFETDSEKSSFIQYDEDGTAMVAVVFDKTPSGWYYVRTQTKKEFDGAVYSKSQTLNITLLSMLVIGVAGIIALGYRQQIQRRRADQRFQALFQHAPDLVSVLDSTGRIIFSSPSTTSVLGFEPGSLAGHSVFDVLHPEDEPQMRGRLGTLLADPSAVLRLQCRVRTASGEYRWFDFTASNQMQNPALNGIVINARDVSENRAFQERLEHEAQHDPLTGLPNRRRMQDKLNSTLTADAVAVLFVDLDGFKPVNDVHGHEVGDELLRQVADRLSACVRADDVLARVGGDEFVILMPGVLTPEDAENMSGRVRYVLELPFRIDGHEIAIGASVGVHLAPAAADPDEALRAADHAMYETKHTGRMPAGAIRVGRHRAGD
ncbi:diguanylate cyclase domain-containing protein [Actinoplanes utahensis]|uniref:Diguanylate cyclase n=1 Tax=Actinoplanes utahensis TaxID=1869 RepID=A0A0A6ULI4_ACTUT|nr:diguanylate cyclase [Actinoplanes utahensis]KHD75923.1 diguanylate cyclase [Actinoplanes utahensis]GIF35024.1 hypothetical protein Aut01nite_80100 [Actinoplanes utahensis]